LFAALIDTITATDEVIYVAGKARSKSNGNFLVVKLIKPVAQGKTFSCHIKPDYTISVAPNPAHSNINIQFVMPQAGKAVIQLTGYNGNIIKQQTQYFTVGKQQLAVQLPDLVPGVYHITITSAAGSDSHAIVLE